MRTKLAVHMMKVEIPLNVIDELNDHIDKVVIPVNDDYSDGLVGQINRDKRSAQLNFDLFDGGVGSEFKKILDSSCKSLTYKQGWGQDVTADAFDGQFIVMLVIIIHYTTITVELKQDFQ